MRKTLLSILGLLCFMIMQAQVTKTVNMTQAGTLSYVLTEDEKSTITDLTLTGPIDARDFKTMRDLMPMLAVLDIEGVNIVEYSGPGTDPFAINSKYSENEIPRFAFYKSDGKYNTILKTITLPISITSIGYSAFYSCSGLIGELNLPDGVTSIGERAFFSCTSLTGKLILPSGLTSIGISAFQNCPGFSGSLILPEGIKSIGSGAFYYCSGLTGELKLPSSLTSVSSAYAGCSGLTSVLFPASITAISQFAFKNCSGLKELNLPSELTSISEYAFQNCSSLTGELHLPSKLTSIERGAFHSCVGLSSIRCAALSPPNLGTLEVFDNTMIKIAYVPKGSKIAYESAKYWKYFAIIDEEAAYTLNITTPGSLGTTLINEGGRPNKVTSLVLTGELNNEDFLLVRDHMPLLHTIDMKGLTNTSIPNEAFYKKATLLNVELPSELTIIGINAFSGCRAMSCELNHLLALTSIGDYAFQDCSGLSGQLVLPEGITSIGKSAFLNCNGLSGELILPNNLTSIGDRAFQNCLGFTGEMHFPYGLSTIPNYLFSDCSGLNAIVLKENITKIGALAFSGCTNLSKITCEAVTPPSVGTNVFDFINIKTCELHVPQGKILDYILDNQWGKFTNVLGLVTQEGRYLASFVITKGGTVQCNGSKATNGSKIEIKAGESMNLTFAPQAAYALDQVLYDGEDVTAQVQDNQWTSPAFSKAVTVSVSFKTVQYEVAILTVGSGFINAHIVEHNSTHTYRLAATEGYLIEKITLNGEDVTPDLANGKLTLDDITKNQTIVATLKHDGETSEIGVSSDKTIRTWKANGQLFVESSEEMSAAEVVDMSGRTACSISKTAYAYVLNLSSNGVYVVRIRTVNGEVKTVKVAM